MCCAPLPACTTSRARHGNPLMLPPCPPPTYHAVCTVIHGAAGCSDGGIGSALCKALLDRRYTVFATARDVSKMASLRGRPGAHLLPLDVTDSASVRQAVADVIKMAGRIDVLVGGWCWGQEGRWAGLVGQCWQLQQWLCGTGQGQGLMVRLRCWGLCEAQTTT